MRGWWTAGVAAAALTWLLLVAVQVVAGDPLPPRISISQYGLGPSGAVFSAWMLTVAAAPCLLYCYRPARRSGARWWLMIGMLGAALMATVRTDPGGLQLSVHAKVHMVGAALALTGLPLGMLLTMLPAARAWRRIAMGLIAVSAVSLELLLVSAAGFDTSGFGAAASWSLWQSVAVAADMVLLVAEAFAVRTVLPLPGDPEPWWAGAEPMAVAGRLPGGPATETRRRAGSLR